MYAAALRVDEEDGERGVDADEDLDAEAATEAADESLHDDDDEGDTDGDDEMESPGVGERERVGLRVGLTNNSTERQVDTRRMRLLSVSATNTEPAMSAARP
jgi:hypothetical protein